MDLLVAGMTEPDKGEDALSYPSERMVRFHVVPIPDLPALGTGDMGREELFGPDILPIPRDALLGHRSQRSPLQLGMTRGIPPRQLIVGPLNPRLPT